MSYFHMTDKKPLTPISNHTSLIVPMFRQVHVTFFYLNSFNLNNFFVKHSVLVFVCFNLFCLKNKKLKNSYQEVRFSITSHAFKNWVDLHLSSLWHKNCASSLRQSNLNYKKQHYLNENWEIFLCRVKVNKTHRHQSISPTSQLSFIFHRDFKFLRQSCHNLRLESS